MVAGLCSPGALQAAMWPLPPPVKTVAQASPLQVCNEQDLCSRQEIAGITTAGGA